ncbi:MAG: hypothetical protein PHP42_03190 [Bacteroidota bacterium]|nr:hypothetical protein [Bacteroidota bacterium]
MSTASLTTLLHEAQQNVLQVRYADALRVIREAKIFDLHNLYIAAFEHWVSKLPYEFSPASDAVMQKHIVTLFVERACADSERRAMKRTEHFAAPDQKAVEQERMKNLYFQRTDELLERKEYERALEEVRRIYIFDSINIVAKEYEQKIEQLISLTATKD